MSEPGFQPPPYPYDLLDGLRDVAAAHPGGAVDLSVGTPTDPPPPMVVEALATSDRERSYPASVGVEAFRRAASDWMASRLGCRVDPALVAACVGTKEFVAGLPHLLRLRRPARDVVLYPAVSYPSYAMGAELAGCRAVPVSLDAAWHLDLSSVSDEDADRALCLWVNSPANPAGAIDDVAAAAAWGRARGIPVFSDECYVEFTWSGEPTSALADGLDGVVAVHSLSKRSNLAGLRSGFYAGDAELVAYLAETRKHAGLMVPGPSQAAATLALADQDHVVAQRARYLARLQALRDLLATLDVPADLPAGGFYLWVSAPRGDAWGLAQRLAEVAGVVVSPGEFYGPAGAGYVRLAAVASDDRIAMAAERVAAGS